MRQHRAFGLACGARGVKLNGDVLPCDRDVRVFARLCIAPSRIGQPAWRSAFGGDESPNTRQLSLDPLDQRQEFRPHEQHGRLAVLDNKSDLRTCEPPAHRRHHDIGFHRAEQQLKIDVAVLAEIGDTLARFDTPGYQRVGDTVGEDIEFGEAGLAALEFIRDSISSGFRPRTNDLGKACRLLNIGHLAPESFVFFVLTILASARNKDNTAIPSRGRRDPFRSAP